MRFFIVATLTKYNMCTIMSLVNNNKGCMHANGKRKVMKIKIVALMLLAVLAGVSAQQLGIKPGVIAWAGLSFSALFLLGYCYLVSRIDL